MKFSYNWICEFVEGVDTPAAELSQLITMKTAESEGVEPYAPYLDQVCAARVESVEPVAGGHNVKAVVATGRYGVKTVVCGAPNCTPGVVTAYVPAGVSLGGRAIEKAIIHGIESDGMLASGVELGVNRDSAGILELRAEPGDPLPGCRPDWIIEIDNKSLTHRPDLWGHHGMAREVAAVLRKRLLEAADLSLLPAGASPVKVEIENYDLVPRYSALLVENVTVGPSPLWLQYRLESIGLNPISNIVDITNLILAEIAQPMHAFDADMLKGETIYARPARAGEKIMALNGERYEVGPSNVVIADAGGPVAIGGVIGGLDSAICSTTRRIVLESANFLGSGIRKTSTQLGLRTDASARFEKSQDPANTLRGLARAVALLAEVSPGMKVVGGVADALAPAVAATVNSGYASEPIELPMGWLRMKLGRDISPREVREILESLEFRVAEPKPKLFAVSVPSWRATRDISIKDDLLEEVGRIVGYDTITPQPPLVATRPPVANRERRFHHDVRAAVSAQGFTEVYNYSFISEEMARTFGYPPEDHLQVANPISSDQTLLRRSLIPGLWKNVLDNSRHFDEFRLFEIGYEIHKEIPAGDDGLPTEIPHLAAAIYAKEGDGEAGLFELKRLAECVLRGAVVKAAEAHPYEHPARSATLIWRGQEVGRMFEFHPNLVEGRAAALDIDLAEVLKLGPAEIRHRPLWRFPTSAFDLSVVAPVREPVAELEGKLRALAADDLVSLAFVTSFEGAPLPEGTKSVSYRLVVGAQDHTLSSEEAGAIRQRVIEGLRQVGYDLRI